MAESFKTLLGENVSGKKGEVAVESFIGEGKVVGLYFSAHWCPPCRFFTPKLAEFYEQFKKSKGDLLEIVFVSSDGNEGEFESYYKDMPWLALPFSARDVKGKLASKYGVSSIPTLILLDGKDGSLITKDGRGRVADDFEGVKFPWRT